MTNKRRTRSSAECKRARTRSRCQFPGIVAKQGAAAQEQVKKAEEAKSKNGGLKAHFDAGNALIAREASEADLQEGAPDQRDALKQKLRLFRIRPVKEFQELQESCEKDPNAHLVGSSWERPTTPQAAMTTLLRPISRLSPQVRDVPGYYNNMGNVLARAGKIEEARRVHEERGA